MDQPWVAEVVEALGSRYKLGPTVDDAVELLFRFGKAQFRSTRLLLGDGKSGRMLVLTVDFRIPEGSDPQEAVPLVEALESHSMEPRGFNKVSDDTAPMTNERGKARGFVRSVKYQREGEAPKETAKQIRAVIESIDIPVVLGIHEAEDLVARDPRPETKRVRKPIDPLDHWEYRLSGGLLNSLTVIIDPNVRTLKVVERKLVSSKTLQEEPVKLAKLSKFGVRRGSGKISLVAVDREGAETILATDADKDEFAATAQRMAKKVMIPIENL